MTTARRLPPAAGRVQRDDWTAFHQGHRLPLGESSATMRRPAAAHHATACRWASPARLYLCSDDTCRRPPPAAGRDQRDQCGPIASPDSRGSLLPVDTACRWACSARLDAGRVEHLPSHRLPLVRGATACRWACSARRRVLPLHRLPLGEISATCRTRAQAHRLALNGLPPPAAGRVQRDEARTVRPS